MPRTARHGNRPALTICAGLVASAVVVVGTATVLARPVAPLAPVDPIAAEDPPHLDDPTDVAPPAAQAGPADPADPAAITGHLGGVEVVELAVADSGLFQADQAEDTPPVTDAVALGAAVVQARQWLDAHLTARGAPDAADDHAHVAGLPPPVGASDDDAGAQLEVVPDGAAVEYHVVAGVRGLPEWLDVEVVVATEDRTWREQAVLAVAEDGTVTPLAREHR